MRDYEILRKALMDAWRGQYCSDCELNSLCQDDDSNCWFKQAADAIEEMLAELVAIRNQLPTWISVEDELPEENKQIISYLAYKGMAVLQYENKHFYMQGAFQPLPKEAVTHWMPLPKAPAPPTEPKGVE